MSAITQLQATALPGRNFRAVTTTPTTITLSPLVASGTVVQPIPEGGLGVSAPALAAGGAVTVQVVTAGATVVLQAQHVLKTNIIIVSPVLQAGQSTTPASLAAAATLVSPTITVQVGLVQVQLDSALFGTAQLLPMEPGPLAKGVGTLVAPAITFNHRILLEPLVASVNLSASVITSVTGSVVTLAPVLAASVVATPSPLGVTLGANVRPNSLSAQGALPQIAAAVQSGAASVILNSISTADLVIAPIVQTGALVVSPILRCQSSIVSPTVTAATSGTAGSSNIMLSALAGGGSVVKPSLSWGHSVLIGPQPATAPLAAFEVYVDYGTLVFAVVSAGSLLAPVVTHGNTIQLEPLTCAINVVTDSIIWGTDLGLNVLRGRSTLMNVRTYGGVHPDITPPIKEFPIDTWDREFVAREDLVHA